MSENNAPLTEEEFGFLNALVQEKMNHFLAHLVRDFSFNDVELVSLYKTLESYVVANLNLGTALVLGEILSAQGYTFNEDLSNPIPEHETKVRAESLTLIYELRSMGMNTADLNDVTEDMKAVGKAAQNLGKAHGLRMIDRKK